MAAPASLASMQEALQVLSGAWYRLAADAGSSMSGTGLSREQEVKLIGALQDAAAAFARCARACREGESAVTPVIAAHTGRTDHGVSWFASRRPPRERVA